MSVFCSGKDNLALEHQKRAEAMMLVSRDCRRSSSRLSNLRPYSGMLILIELFALPPSPVPVPSPLAPWLYPATCPQCVMCPICGDDLIEAMHFADWENKTTAVIAYREGKGRMLKKERANSEALLARRRRLADLYNEEMERWEHEVQPMRCDTCLIRHKMDLRIYTESVTGSALCLLSDRAPSVGGA